MLVDLTQPLTCEDVAGIVGVDNQTVMRWARQCELDGVKAEGARRDRKVRILAWAEVLR